MTRYTPQVIGVSADNVVTLTNKTIDGDDNTLQDIATTSVKANNTGRVIVSGVMNPTLTTSPITITELNQLDGILSDAVGVDDTQTITNKSISDTLTVDTINSYTLGNAVVIKELSLGDLSTLIISTGAITITTGYHKVQSESGTTDDLTTINGGSIGQILVLTVLYTHTVTVKDNTDNLRLSGDFILTHDLDTLTLIYNGTTWNEISRSDNS